MTEALRMRRGGVVRSAQSALLEAGERIEWRSRQLMPTGMSARQALDGAEVLAEAVTGRPRRRVVPHPLGWAVTHEGGWTTTDEVLAREVASYLNRVAPLPCPHRGLWLEVTRLGFPGPEWLCGDCGHMRRGESA